MKYKLKENVTEEQLVECGFEKVDNKNIFSFYIDWKTGEQPKGLYTKHLFLKTRNIGIVVLENKEVVSFAYLEIPSPSRPVKCYIQDLIAKGYVEVEDGK